MDLLEINRTTVPSLSLPLTITCVHDFKRVKEIRKRRLKMVFICFYEAKNAMSSSAPLDLIATNHHNNIREMACWGKLE